MQSNYALAGATRRRKNIVSKQGPSTSRFEIPKSMTPAELARLNHDVDQEDIADVRQSPYWARLCEKYKVHPVRMTFDQQGHFVVREEAWKFESYVREIDKPEAKGKKDRQVLEVEFYTGDIVYVLLVVNGLLRQTWIKTLPELQAVLKHAGNWELVRQGRGD